MLKAIIFFFSILTILIVLFGFFYERVSSFVSTVLTKRYYKTHPLLTKTDSKIESKNYVIKKLSDFSGYAGNIQDSIFYDTDSDEFVWEYYEAQKDIIISKNGAIVEVDKKLRKQRQSKLLLDIFPKKYHEFEHSWKARGQPINIVNYHKKRFEWPQPCPYVGIPLCGGLMWYGNAFFEVAHNGEKLKFHLDTNQLLFNGYNGQIFKLSLPETTNTKIAFLNVNMSSNDTSRSLGWYVILPKTQLNNSKLK